MKPVWSFLPPALACVLILLSAGCTGSAPVSPGPLPSASASPAVTTEGLPSPLLEYHRSGGIAGFSDHLYIWDNGTTVVSGRRMNTTVLQLNATEIREITVLLDQASRVTREQATRQSGSGNNSPPSPASGQGPAIPEGPYPDQMTITLRYQGMAIQETGELSAVIGDLFKKASANAS